MSHSQTPIFTAAADWAEPLLPAPGAGTIWNAHRPLLGESMWEGASRYGVHYAFVPFDSPNRESWNANNRAMDGRMVILMTNAEVMEAADFALREQGYALYDYFAALAGETAETIMRQVAGQFSLPWSANDRSADERTAALMAEAAGVS